MSTDERSTVLACIDGSDYSDAVVDYAAWVASRVEAPLKLLHNIERREYPPVSDLSGNIGLGTREELLEELTDIEERRSRILLDQGKLMLESASERARPAGVSQISTLQRHGSLTESLIEMEEEVRVLVIGVRGESHAHRTEVIGEHLEGVIRALHRPILVVNRPFDEAPRRCMIDYDGSEGARKALAMVATSPLFQDMTCHLVHVAREAESPLLAEAAELLHRAGITATTKTLQGDVEQQLRDYQLRHQIELTVMGAFGRGRLREMLFGSLTLKMLTHSPMPLLLLR